MISEIYKTGKLQLTNREILSNRIKSRQDSKMHLTSREAMQYSVTEAIKRAETVIEQPLPPRFQEPLPPCSTISMSSCDKYDTNTNRNKLDETKKVILHSLKPELY